MRRPAELLRPTLLNQVPGIRAAMSTRIGGDSYSPFGMNTSFSVGDNESRVHDNRRDFFSQVGISPLVVSQGSQVHSASVVSLKTLKHGEECDGLVTNEPEKYVSISVADCVPVLLVDPLHNAVAAVHAGWRGTASGIVGAAAKKMSEEFGSDPGSILAWVGPGASSCCYRVGEEVAARFDESVIRRTTQGTFVDVKLANKLQLRNLGITEDHIEMHPACTICDTRFHSFRRDGMSSGRMLAVIGMQKGV